MAGDTLGNCPLCGHREASYDDWESLGYMFTREWNDERVQVRVWRCRTCDGLVTPDYERTPDGNHGMKGTPQAFRPEAG